MSSVIDLCGTMFRWAKFRPTKGSVKLHLLLDHDGYLLFLWCHHRGQVAFGARGSGRCDLSQGKILVFDRGYMDCEWPLEFGQARGSSRGAPERKRRLLGGGGTPASEWAGMVIKNAGHLFVLFSSERIKLLPCQLGVLPGFTIHASNLSLPFWCL